LENQYAVDFTKELFRAVEEQTFSANLGKNVFKDCSKITASYFVNKVYTEKYF